MKHRKGKRYVRHGRIEGLDDLLKKIEKWAEVSDIISGQIHDVPSGGRGHGLYIRVQRIDEGKVKCVASRTGLRQELVIVSAAPEQTADKIREESWGR